VEGDGNAVLFVDVTDVIRLNVTAATLVNNALDGIPLEQTRRALLNHFAVPNRPQLERDLTQLYALVARLRTTDTCATCAVAELVQFAPVFSLPVTAPYKVDIALTYACNNACAHCYNEATRRPMPSLTTAAWYQVFDKLAAIGVPHVILTGGEPTLHPDLPALIRYANARGLIVGMNTNGRALAQRPFVETLVAAGLNHVQVTLESNRAAVHNAMVGAPAFAQTVQGIQNALATGIHVITNTTLTTQNYHHALETIDFVQQLGLRTFAMNGMIYAGGGNTTADALAPAALAATLIAVRARAAELAMRFLWYTVTEYCQLSPLELGLDPKRCNAAEYSMCIEPNGDVLPCQSYYVSAGNLLTDSWESIWNSALFRSFRERVTHPEAAGLPAHCHDCPDLTYCGGGCRLEREALSGARAVERGCSGGNNNKSNK